MSKPITSPESSKLLRAAIWVAIGALIAAAIVCVVWVLIGSGTGIVARAFMTVLLLAGFAGIAILESHLAGRRPAWFALTSMGSWVVALLVGAVMIWLPSPTESFGWGYERFMRFLLVVLILQLALLHLRLFTKAYLRNPTTFLSIVTYVTIAFVGIVAVMLIVPLVGGEWFDFLPIYWRVVVALTILAAVGTALVPLVNALLMPRPPHPPAAAPWPTYADGRTPLPVLGDGSPDWQAYYTGRPTYPQGYAPAQQAPAHPTAAQTTPPTQAPAQPGYQDYPPPPPLPDRPIAPR
ncbi:hypothetical protein CBF90_09860 [Microbacterium sp. AISO3]|uniref:hypothetical protein n=1 Tax=Microbacterium sp. AISO3 TaxID=2002831 RepID=UPI000B4C6BAB|nr:hypothetical protein [Microbacterium sp. AISO3]OWP21974.1 hypothetical protein CBF90_09860 [Microbacterium sp. AISO3]